jgi:glucose-1-phosphate cytidylyltransferase
MIETLRASDKLGLFLAARPTAVFHVVEFDDAGIVRSLRDVGEAGLWINAGFFVFRREIFDYIRDGEDLVEEPFQRLIEDEKLIAFPNRGFWAPMDTLKDKQNLDSLVESGRAPWALWDVPGGEAAEPVTAGT